MPRTRKKSDHHHVYVVFLQPGGPLDEMARAHDASPSQIALAWLLGRSPLMLPIPGTSKVSHLEENIAAAQVRLDDDEIRTLADAVG